MLSEEKQLPLDSQNNSKITVYPIFIPFRLTLTSEHRYEKDKYFRPRINLSLTLTHDDRKPSELEESLMRYIAPLVLPFSIFRPCCWLNGLKSHTHKIY